MGYRIPGYIGIAIYGSLFLYTFLMILQSIFRTQTSIKYFNYKLGFHFVFGSYCLLETIYSYSMTIHNRFGLSSFIPSMTPCQHSLVGLFASLSRLISERCFIRFGLSNSSTIYFFVVSQ
jgi:hypothetical protein